MESFIETLRLRAAEAQKRQAAAQVRLQQAQTEFNAASVEFNSWNHALATETRRVHMEGQAASIAIGHALAVIGGSRRTAPALSQPSVASAPTPAPPATASEPEINKTEVVRGFLRQRTNGATPDEIWKALKDQIGNHAYLYSILKRLYDAEELTKKRGKYSFKHQPTQADEVANHNGVVEQH